MSSFKILTTGNPKIEKGNAKGYWTFILHLAPAKLSGYQTCPMATEGCKAACLNTAGRGGMIAGRGPLTLADLEAGTYNTIQKARIRKTKRFFEDRQGFMTDLVAEIRRAVALAERKGLIPVFRLNGTSDIRWESVGIASEGGRRVHDVFPNVQFYDYTKLPNRKNVPANYALTFSLADGNDAQAEQAMLNGFNVAVVFRSKAVANDRIANGWGPFSGMEAWPVHPGDESDLRFLDPKGPDGLGAFVALYAKGNAKRDTSGFVVD
jgi:hypothetical protein